MIHKQTWFSSFQKNSQKDNCSVYSFYDVSCSTKLHRNTCTILFGLKAYALRVCRTKASYTLTKKLICFHWLMIWLIDFDQRTGFNYSFISKYNHNPSLSLIHSSISIIKRLYVVWKKKLNIKHSYIHLIDFDQTFYQWLFHYWELTINGFK